MEDGEIEVKGLRRKAVEGLGDVKMKTNLLAMRLGQRE